MLRAIDLQNEEYISYKINPLDFDEKIDLFCPHCEEKIIFVQCSEKINHFRHYPKTKCITRLFEPESEEHIEMKKKVYEILEKDKRNKDIKTEVIFGDQIADVHCKHQNLDFVIECQCSNISKKKFEQRHNGWNKKGVYHMWIFGKKFVNIYENSFGQLVFGLAKGLAKKWHNLYFIFNGNVIHYNDGEIINDPLFKPYLSINGKKCIIIPKN